ncbi:MAG TPA: glycosyltransferase 87 family protein [Acidobacteriota bacterium]|nr:glycosyltransferase 87 family protein [Acidobacteriota bacterium]
MARYVALAVTLCVGGLVLVHLIELAAREAKCMTHGFPTNYTASRLWLSGENKANLQEWDWFRRQSAALGFTSTDVFWGNPPSLALLLVPLAWLSPAKARVVWTILSLAAWFAGLELLRRTTAPTNRFSTGLLTSVSLAVVAALYDPFHANLHLGQIYAFLFLLESAACVLWLNGRSFASGILSGSLLAFKGYGIQLIALALFRRERRVLAGAAVSFTLLAGLASLRLGLHSWFDFLRVHVGERAFSGTAVPALQTLRSLAGVALLPAYHPGGVPPVVSGRADAILSILSAVLQLILLMWLARSPGKVYTRLPINSPDPPTPFVLAACMAAGLIFSPRAENHAYCLALASLILMMSAFNRIGTVSLLSIAAGVLLVWPFHFQTRSVLDYRDLVMVYPRLWGAVFILIAALIAERTHRHRPDRPQHLQSSVSGTAIAWLTGFALILYYVKPWRDPLDGPTLIVSRTKANAVSCLRLDVDEREVVSIPVSCAGPFGTALGLDRRWLYCACTDNSKLSVIDLHNRREAQILNAPSLAAWAKTRPNASEVWVSNEGAATVTIYETGNTRVLAEVHTGDGPSDICFTPDGESGFVSNEASNSVSWIDASSRKKLWEIPVGKVPQGLALTRDGRFLLVADYGSDQVSVVGLREHRELVRISTGRGPVDIAVPPRGADEFAYVTCFDAGTVSVLDVSRNREVARLPVGNHIFGIAAHPDDERLYVCSGGTDEIVVLRGGTRAGILRRIPLPGSPLQLTVVP